MYLEFIAFTGIMVVFILGLILLIHSNSLKGRLVGIILLICLGLTLTHISTVGDYKREVRLQEQLLKNSLIFQTDYRLLLEDGSVYNLTFLDDNIVHFEGNISDNNAIFNYLIIENDLTEVVICENGLLLEPTINKIVFENETVSKTFIIETQENRNRELFGTLVTETDSQQVWMRSN